MNLSKPVKYAIFLTSLFAVTCQSNFETTDSRDDIFLIQATDADFNAAIIHARETFPEFLEMKDKNNPNYSDFNVKIGLPNSEGTTEHIWVSNVSYEDDRFRATLINEPFALPNYEVGDTVFFGENQVSDWQYLKNGKSEGNFTTRVALKTMADDKADEVRKTLGWNN